MWCLVYLLLQSFFTRSEKHSASILQVKSSFGVVKTVWDFTEEKLTHFDEFSTNVHWFSKPIRCMVQIQHRFVTWLRANTWSCALLWERILHWTWWTHSTRDWGSAGGSEVLILKYWLRLGDGFAVAGSGPSKGVDLLLHFHWPVSSHWLCRGLLQLESMAQTCPRWQCPAPSTNPHSITHVQ